MSATSSILVQRRVPATGLPSASSLRAWATQALGHVAGELTIRIVDETESRALNRRYRSIDKSTNVLSFAYDGDLLEVPVLGDLAICAPVVQREAQEQHKELRAHWAHMVVHGCLHLLGYDHAKNREAERMEARETEILAALGFPDPYAIGTAGLLPQGREMSR